MSNIQPEPEPPPGLPDEPAREDFWEERYKHGYAPWDLGAPAPPFVDLMSGPGAPRPGRLVVLGAGRGNDAIFFAQQGFEVTAVDFAPTAIEAARQNAQAHGASLEFVCHNLFDLGGRYGGAFDYVLEHTCFAAIPVIMREEYVQVVRRLLKPGGKYIALLPTHGRPGGPPFSTDEAEIRALFGPYFEIERLEVPGHSAAGRQGKERFALMRLLENEQAT